MRINESEQIVVGLDIGTSRVLAVSGKPSEKHGRIQIVGVGESMAVSEGLKSGAVVNVDAITNAITQAITRMQIRSPCGEIGAVYVGLAGKDHIHSCNSHGVVAIGNRVVSSEDIRQVLDPAQVVPTHISKGRLLHVIPQEYVVDGQRGVKEPCGMVGNRLESKVHVVVCDESAAENLESCVRRANLEVLGIFLNQVAAGNAVLTREEKEAGVCLVDIGADTSDIAVFSQGKIQYTAMIPVGGRSVTSDIAKGLQIPEPGAEKIKIEHGCASPQLAPVNQELQITSPDNRSSSKLNCQLLARIINCRYQELLEFVNCQLNEDGYADSIDAGVVLTGGASRMSGLQPVAEEVFQKKIRIAVPIGVEGLSEVVNRPDYATAVGILMQGIACHQQHLKQPSLDFGGKLKSWFGGRF